MKKLTRLFLSLGVYLLTFGVAVPAATQALAVPAAVSAGGFQTIAAAETSNDAACNGLAQVAGSTGTHCAAAGDTGPGPGTNAIGGLAKSVVNIISLIAGMAAVIMIIVGGVKFVTSGGDSNATASARNTIIYAVIGLVVVALAQLIVHVVLGNINSGGALTT